VIRLWRKWNEETTVAEAVTMNYRSPLNAGSFKAVVQINAVAFI